MGVCTRKVQQLLIGKSLTATPEKPMSPEKQNAKRAALRYSRTPYDAHILYDRPPGRELRYDVHSWNTAADVPHTPPSFVELYDLRNDPDETRNLSDDPSASNARQQLAKTIRQHIQQHIKKQND